MTAQPQVETKRREINGFRRIMIGAIATLVGLGVTSVWFQLGSYASANELETVRADCSKKHEAAKVERDMIRKDVSDIKVAIGSIDTALEILLDNYKKAKKDRQK